MESASTAFEKRRRVVNSDSMPNVMKVASPKLHHVQSENRASSHSEAASLKMLGRSSATLLSYPMEMKVPLYSDTMLTVADTGKAKLQVT